MDKPKKVDYGYQDGTSYDEPSGWTIEGGEEAYYEDLKEWEEEHK